MSPDDTNQPQAEAKKFYVPSHTWFIAPFPRPTDQVELIRHIRQMGVVIANGKEGTVIPIFSDLDLAERFVAKLDDRDSYKPLSFDSSLGIAEVLYRLIELGETHVLFD